ncbi:immunoglobulin domain-containing protein [Chryseobacterium sp. TY4]
MFLKIFLFTRVQSLEILVKLDDIPAPTAPTNPSFCIGKNPTLTNINITGQNSKFYNAANILLAQTPTIVDGETYYASQSIAGCESTNRTGIRIEVTYNSIAATNYQEPAFCNHTIDDFKLIKLNDCKTKLIANIKGLKFDFYNANREILSDYTKTKLNICNYIIQCKNQKCFGRFAVVYIKI